MKAVIHLSDSKKRNSRVNMESGNQLNVSNRVTSGKANVERYRAVKNSLKTSLSSLTKETSLEDLSQTLIDGDPELDLELYGKRIYKTTRVYLNTENEPAFGVQLKEFIYQKDGDLKEERKLDVVESNINLESPIKWTGRHLPKKDFYKKFAFVNSFQITHIDGLTFDFLFEMAKELEEKDSFLFLAGGEKSNEPLIFSRNGLSYRGFLEGRTKEDSFMLILHLSNLELKAVKEGES